MTKIITSLKSFVNYVMRIRKESLYKGLNSYQWFFRGQENSSWSIYPNVFRNDGLDKETKAIQSALRQNPFEFQNKNDFEILTKLQHYGLGTRLLDVTLNPLVALYFATEESIEYKENRNGQFSQDKKDGVVFFQYAPWHSTNELCIRIASSIPFFEIDDTWTTSVFLDELHKNRIISDDEKDALKNDNYKMLIEYLQDSFFVISSHSNERLIRQSGAFIIPTFMNFSDDHNRGNSLIKKSYKAINEKFSEDAVVIPAKNKEDIRDELDFFNINEATLFPELEHQMTYIKRQHVPIVGSTPYFLEAKSIDNIEPKESDYNERIPDVRKVIDTLGDCISNSAKESIVDGLYELVKLVDWKQKESIRSQIKRTCKHILQGELSVIDSNRLSEQILSDLLSPSEEMSQEQ